MIRSPLFIPKNCQHLKHTRNKHDGWATFGKNQAKRAKKCKSGQFWATGCAAACQSSHHEISFLLNANLGNPWRVMALFHVAYGGHTAWKTAQSIEFSSRRRPDQQPDE